MEPLMGEIKMFAGNFAPNGWFFCDGSSLPVNQYSALFALLGTTYGGDGMQTFQLPDLRGRTPIHSGNGQGRNVSRYELGQIGGNENVTLSSQQMPVHNHNIQGVAGSANQFSPEGDYLSISVDKDSGNPTNIYNDGSDATVPFANLGAKTVLPAGGSQPVNIVTPYLGINYIIAWTGVWPSRP